jgi:predicted GNAT superfamily acetyltransferase
MSSETIEIQPLTTLAEFDGCVQLQRRVWGFADLEVVSRDIFIVVAKIGGQVFGAFAGAELVGFVLAFPGLRHGRPYLHSHMAAVLPDYQNLGIGRRLKLRQREEALARGIELVEWTFDPLELRNAYFNLVRLGAIIRRFVPDQYGQTSSPLHSGLPTDRFIAEWWLKTPRVEAAIAGQPLTPRPDCQRITVPRAISELKQTDAAAAGRIQAELRAQFEQWLGRGYAITGFELTAQAGAYLLEPDMR